MAVSPRMAIENESFPLASYLALMDFRLVICAIPKVGCSTIKRWVVQNLNPDALVGEGASVDIHKVCRDRYSLVALNAIDPDAVLDESLCCTFIRDPLTRLASAFVDKFCGPRVDEMTEGAIELIEDVHRRRGVDVTHDTTLRCVGGTIEVPACSRVNYVRGVTFREFVEHVCESEDSAMDLHWRPQVSFLAGRSFDLVARVENLTPCLQVISRQFGLAEPEKHRENPTLYTDDLVEMGFADMHCGDMRRHWVRPRAQRLFTAELRERVLERFAADADLYEGTPTTLDALEPVLIKRSAR